MKLIIILKVIFISTAVFASDVPPTFSIQEIFLQTTGKLQENAQGGLEYPQWKISTHARFLPSLEINTSVGASSLLYLPQWSTSQAQTISLLEAVAKVRTPVADFYAGQFLIPFGLEGIRKESELYFPRSFLFERGLIPLRDYGLGLFSLYEGFYFNFSVHSGEGGQYTSSVDNRLFATAQWGYETPTQEKVGMSISEGRTYNSTTFQETKLRAGNLFFKFRLFKVNIELEGSLFQTETALSSQGNYLTWHGDFDYRASDSINLIARYEQYNPNTKAAANVIGRGFLGLEWHGKNSLSRLFLYLVKNNESQTETPNDEVQIAWRITPL